MRSLEKMHRNRDLDQVDPEHINRVEKETTWDDLKNVPFMGGQINKDELRAQEILRRMDEVGSFGKRARDNRGSQQAEKIRDKSDYDNMSLSDISSTF